MTPEEKETYTRDVRAEMLEFVKRYGNNNNIIMSNLPDIYRNLEEKGLVKFGLTYQLFSQIANEEFMKEMMGF